MFTSEALQEIHRRTHQNLKDLLSHCRGLSAQELNRELPGFGFASVRLQLHHAIGAEKYWVGVLQGRIDADDDSPDFPTVATLEAYRGQVFEVTEGYLRKASSEELNTARTMITWGNRERVLTPAHVVLRTQVHIYHHQGQVTAMCRLLENPVSGMDYPIA